MDVLQRIDDAQAKLLATLAELRAIIPETGAVRVMGLGEVAAYTQRSKATVGAWRSRGARSFPRPLAELECGPIWLAEQIENWWRWQQQVEEYQREHGRPKRRRAPKQ